MTYWLPPSSKDPIVDPRKSFDVLESGALLSTCKEAFRENVASCSSTLTRCSWWANIPFNYYCISRRNRSRKSICLEWPKPKTKNMQSSEEVSDPNICMKPEDINQSADLIPNTTVVWFWMVLYLFVTDIKRGIECWMGVGVEVTQWSHVERQFEEWPGPHPPGCQSRRHPGTLTHVAFLTRLLRR